MYIFDLDDTLIATLDTVQKKIYRGLAAELNLQNPTSEKIKQHWGGDLISSLSHIFDCDIANKFGEEFILSILINLHKKYPVQAFDDVKRTLGILKKHNKGIALFTSSHPSIMQICLGNNFDDNIFDYIFNTTVEGIQKPSKKIIANIKKQYEEVTNSHINREEILVIGDSIADLKTAKGFGADFIGITTGATSVNTFLHEDLPLEFISTTFKDALTASPDHGVVVIVKNDNNEFLLLEEARINNKHYKHWSGPHGRCIREDILEEETVVRETMEEVGVEVIPIKKLCTQPADSKIKTVSFWEAKLTNPEALSLDYRNSEVSNMQWISIDQIKNSEIKLYPGTEKFFKTYINE